MNKFLFAVIAAIICSSAGNLLAETQRPSTTNPTGYGGYSGCGNCMWMCQFAKSYSCAAGECICSY